MTIAQTATAAAADLRQMAPRARQRTLDADDIEHAVRLHLKHAQKVARNDPTRVTMTVLRGGFVPNSYRGRAECDEVTIIGLKAADLSVACSRVWAQSRSYGRGALLVVRSRLPDQSQGRIEHSE